VNDFGGVAIYCEKFVYIEAMYLVYSGESDVYQKLSNELSAVLKYFKENRLFLNAKKT
jgi:hypothetical protein